MTTFKERQYSSKAFVGTDSYVKMIFDVINQVQLCD